LNGLDGNLQPLGSWSFLILGGDFSLCFVSRPA
jgi:hypothetical protein